MDCHWKKKSEERHIAWRKGKYLFDKRSDIADVVAGHSKLSTFAFIERSAVSHLGFVLRMAFHVSQFFLTVSILTFSDRRA